MAQQVVARYQDGRVLKGISMDIDPARPIFHVRLPGSPAVEVDMAELKALFFVRSLEGNPSYNEDPTPNPADPRGRGSTFVRIRFKDGEVLVGMTLTYPPTRNYFFVTPVDPKSNNIRALVNRAAVAAMEAVPKP
jgi:hypothetical protein